MRSIIEDSFAHHAWATLALIDVCLPLSDEQLEAAAPGTFGSILSTMQHLVGSDVFYIAIVSGDRSSLIDAKTLGLLELRAVMEANGEGWTRVLREHPDPDEIAREVDGDFWRNATIGARLAQALHHGNEHRSQICTGLTALGLEAPDLSGWHHGEQTGSVTSAF